MRKGSVLCVLTGLVAGALLPVLPTARADLAERALQLAAEVEDKVPVETLRNLVEQTAESAGLSEAQAWSRVGAGYLFTRSVQPSQYCLAHAAGSRSPDPVAIANLGFLLLDQDRLEDAEAFLTRAQAVAPDSPEVWMNLGMLRWKQGKKDEALEYFEKAAGDTSHAEYSYALAAAQADAGSADAAVETLRLVLDSFPDHQPSRNLYQELTGRAWIDPDVKAICEEALALAQEVRTFVADYQKRLDRIGAAAQQPGIGTQMASFTLRRSDIFVNSCQRHLEDLEITLEDYLGGWAAEHGMSHATEEGYAQTMTTLQDVALHNGIICYQMHLHIQAALIHRYHVMMSVWERGGGTAAFRINPILGYGWRTDFRCLTTEAVLDFHDARQRSRQESRKGKTSAERDWIRCSIVVGPATVCIAQTPVRLLTLLPHLERGLNELGPMDARIVERSDRFRERAMPLYVTDVLASAAQTTPNPLHDFCSSASTSSGSLGDSIQDTVDGWKNFTAWAQREMEAAASEIERCEGVREPETIEDADWQENLAAFFEAWQKGTPPGMTASVKFDLVIVDVKLSSDGKVSVTVGQGIQAEGSYDLLNDRWGAKFGYGYSIENPGIVFTGVEAGGFVTWDEAGGFDAEVETGGSWGGYGLSSSTGPLFATLYDG